MALKPHDPRHADPYYGTGYHLECPDCGRLYDKDDGPLKAGGPCPDDECPSHEK